MNKKIKETFINIGSGKDYSIKQYARIIINNIIPEKNIKIEYDLSKPNGTPRKILDIKLTSKYGWKAKTNLNQAILETYKNFLSQKI
tara:strand:- start:467 stop:727 length:261 start_codon:yes stop_codon:yes gene_type:complete